MDPAQWLADYRERLERAAQGARAASASLREVGATATSPRGEVSVTVNAGGLLDDVTLTPAARRLEADALSVLIVATAREAQRLAGARMAEVMCGYLGEGEALERITDHQPAEVVR
ncbi:YbaB/EbfC family nucleoid-associated protein [Saccharothrix texasensis]|uniref:YbaB/EbfC DNA-binding family protein n=1 Tax=Saccharothrix texasensis TaxID=103734 RepID=A0A3N1GY53_9PSEU|nr:YbaB/EbfC family nucleoid-associated protein [Saccharothrix texasensis]ROP35168.1 YbaB/EbfC DNA-binding family protein [Saccharothrix texasensis]